MSDQVRLHSYMLLYRSGALKDMQEHGVECVDCFAVDNALIKPASPAFVGYCYQAGSECGMTHTFSQRFCKMVANVKMCLTFIQHQTYAFGFV